MPNNFYSHDDFYHEIYFESNQKFEEVRKLCLSEGNWLGKNFEKDRLKIEDHKGFCVVYHKTTHEPVVMGGVFNDGRYPSNVGRHLHRYYSFPKWRGSNKSQLTAGWAVTKVHIVEPLTELNDFDLYIMAMQTRDKKSSKGYFRVWHETMRAAMPYWKVHEQLIQTCPWQVQQCWQNFVYLEIKEGALSSWNPKTISQEEWLLLPLGTD